MQGPDRVVRPISELIVCEGSSLTFYWLENPRPTTGRKALSLRERSTFGSGLVMSWLDEVDQVDFGIFLDIKWGKNISARPNRIFGNNSTTIRRTVILIPEIDSLRFIPSWYRFIYRVSRM